MGTEYGKFFEYEEEVCRRRSKDTLTQTSVRMFCTLLSSLIAQENKWNQYETLVYIIPLSLIYPVKT